MKNNGFKKCLIVAIATLTMCSCATEQSAANDNNEIISSLLAENEKLQSQIDQVSSLNENAEEELSNRNSIIKELSEENDQLSNDLQNTKDQLDVKNDQNDKLNQEIINKDKEIDELNGDLGSVKEQLDNVNEENQTLQNEIDDLKDIINSQERSYNKKGSFFELSENMFEFERWNGTDSSGVGNIIHFHGRTEKTSFEVETIYGRLNRQIKSEVGNAATVERATSFKIIDGDWLYWQMADVEGLTHANMEKNFLKIKAFEDEILVGYAVIEINVKESDPKVSISRVFTHKTLKSAYVEGPVSDEQIESAINDAIYSTNYGRIYSYKNGLATLNEETGLYEVTETLFTAGEITGTSLSTGSYTNYQKLNYIDDANLTFKITTDIGTIEFEQFNSYQKVYCSGDNITWMSPYIKENETFTPTTSYISIVVETMGTPFGYQVLKLEHKRKDDISVISLKSVVIPAMWGKKQEVTTETLKAINQNIIDADKAK